MNTEKSCKTQLFVRKAVLCDTIFLYNTFTYSVHYGSAGADSLIDHLCVGVIWQPQTEALFDIRVVDANGRSYRACTPHDVYCTTEGEKKHKYLLACQNQCKTITNVAT